MTSFGSVAQSINNYGNFTRDFEASQRQDFFGLMNNLAATTATILQQQKQDALANQIANEMNPPRAAALNPSDPAAINANMQFGGPSAPSMGGMQEFKMRRALEEEQLNEEMKRFQMSNAIQDNELNERLANWKMAKPYGTQPVQEITPYQQAALEERKLGRQLSEQKAKVYKQNSIARQKMAAEKALQSVINPLGVSVADLQALENNDPAAISKMIGRADLMEQDRASITNAWASYKNAQNPEALEMGDEYSLNPGLDPLPADPVSVDDLGGDLTMPPGATLTAAPSAALPNFGAPAALQATPARPRSPEEAKALPPGTQFVGPDGRVYTR